MLTGHTRCRYDTFLFNTSSRSSLCPPAGDPRSGVSGRKNHQDLSPFARCANEQYTSGDNRDSQNSHMHNSREGMSTGMWLSRDKTTPNLEVGRHVARPKQHSNLRVTVISCVLCITTPRSLIHTARVDQLIMRLLLIPATPSRSRPKELHDICASHLSVWAL